MLTKFLKMSGFWVLELASVHLRKAHCTESMGTGVRPGFSDTTYELCGIKQLAHKLSITWTFVFLYAKWAE